MIARMKFRLIVSLLPLLLVACSGLQEEDEKAKTETPPVEVLYNQAKDDIDSRRWKKAAEKFEEVERQYPYSQWASKAQMMAAYAHFKQEDYDDAIATCERYIKLYPAGKETPYAYYLIALSYYSQISDVGRNQEMTEKALQALKDVMGRYPESDYARDAKVKLDLTYDHLAGKEMEIGRYYLKRKEWAASINRFQHVVDHYQTTTHAPEALHRLVEIYTALGVKAEAQRNAAVLGHNYPDSPWYADSYALLTGKHYAAEKTDDSWLSKIKNVF